MSGLIGIYAYKPKEGQDAETLAVVREHYPTLLREGLVTSRAPVLGRAADGTLIEVIEWVSEEAVGNAHSNPAVRDLWTRFDQCCIYNHLLSSVPECQKPFASFTPVAYN